MASAVHDYTYSVQVKSRFDLFAKDDYNCEDPDILLKKLRSQKRERKPSTKETPVEKPAQNESEPVQKETLAPRKDRHSDQKPAPRDAVGNARGRGAPRGRGGFTRSKMGSQREFDRHSGSDKTGVKPVVKKDGHGTGNWGTMEDELEAQTEVVEPVAEEKAVEEEVKPVESAAEPTTPVEEQPKKLTLKEYRDQLKASKSNVQLSTKPIRPPNDGKNVFSDMVEVHKSKPIETKVEVVLPEETQNESKKQNNFSAFGRGNRPAGLGQFRGRGSTLTTGRQSHEEPKAVEPTASPSQESTEVTEAPNQRDDRPSQRGGRGAAPRGFRGSSRGRGFAPRNGFNGERGRGFAHRGGFSFERGSGGAISDRPGFRGGNNGPNNDRGGYRGGGNGPIGDRPGFRGGERGRVRGMRGGVTGPREFQRGRGSLDHFQESRGGFRGLARAPVNAAPSMDSDADFPALK